MKDVLQTRIKILERRLSFLEKNNKDGKNAGVIKEVKENLAFLYDLAKSY